MRVKCIATQSNGAHYRMTVGKEYTVFGISVPLANGTCSLWVKDDPGNYFVPTPAVLFEIVDPTVSIYWVIELTTTVLRVSAREFLEPFFLDRLTSRQERETAVFGRVSTLIEDEDRKTEH